MIICGILRLLINTGGSHFGVPFNGGLTVSLESIQNLIILLLISLSVIIIHLIPAISSF